MSSSDEDAYGPPLPPSLRQGSDRGVRTVDDKRPQSIPAASSDDGVDGYGPALPPVKEDDLVDSYGPLPPAKEDSEAGDYGPALPPPRVLGPCRPTADQLNVATASSQQLEEQGSDGEEEEGNGGDMIGPMPCGNGTETRQRLSDSMAAEFDRRALEMKEKLDPNRKPIKSREEWMLELPAYHAKQFGVGARQFRRSAAPERGDTSCWTDTPADSRKRAASAACATPSGGETDSLAVRRRDERIAAVAGRLSDPDSRQHSLLDQHRKRRKQQEKADADTSADKAKRQPFDRDRDLGAKVFDQAQKNAAIKRSRGAADMFSSGSQKFL